MDKRYQVFVSSTYADLKDERQHVIQTLMEMDCIPAGMELFPAADEEQWNFIKRIIDDCDYYLLIIGGRYGSTTSEGISYTEKEFDYAIEKGLRVVALLHEQPEFLSLNKSEIDPVLRSRLHEFRAKVSKDRLVKFWRSPEDLPGLVSLSMQKTIKMYPAVGWVRANRVANESTLSEINELRKKNDELQSLLKQLQARHIQPIEGLAKFDSKITLHGHTYIKYSHGRGQYKEEWTAQATWREIFSWISPYLIGRASDNSVQSQLANDLGRKVGMANKTHYMDDQDFKTISIQLKAYGLVNIEYLRTTNGGAGLFWQLTEKGEEVMMQLRAVKE
jgi:hypothetical protein